MAAALKKGSALARGPRSASTLSLHLGCPFPWQSVALQLPQHSLPFLSLPPPRRRRHSAGVRGPQHFRLTAPLLFPLPLLGYSRTECWCARATALQGEPHMHSCAGGSTSTRGPPSTRGYRWTSQSTPSNRYQLHPDTHGSLCHCHTVDNHQSRSWSTHPQTVSTPAGA